MDFFIAYPLVLVHVIDLARLQLHLLDILIPSECVDLFAQHRYCSEEALLLKHGSFMENILLHELQAVVAHATDEEPRANILILLRSGGVASSGTSIQVNAGEMARELALVFSDKTPLRELLLLCSFNEEPADLIASKFKPEHIVGDVQVQLVLVSVRSE